KDLAERGHRNTRLGLQLLRFDLVDGGELEDELHRQRALVALDQVEIGRRDAEPRGHRRLRQALAVANAADARPGKDLPLRHRIVPYIIYKIAGCFDEPVDLTLFTNLHVDHVKGNTTEHEFRD